jgi:hypothetical protein
MVGEGNSKNSKLLKGRSATMISSNRLGKKIPPKQARVDVVFVRKSTKGQDEQGQISNVRNMLLELGIHVSDQFWFVGTVSRRKTKTNDDFNRLMELVRSDRVGTVFIESQDRWGSADRIELYSLLGELISHGTRLFDLRAKKDLTEKDVAVELLTIVNSIKSEKELQDISYRSLRSRVNNFREKGSWPTGTHPFGYGKACFGADGKLRWVWQPVNRAKGQVFFPGPDGTLAPGPENINIPRKEKSDTIKLVPSNNPNSVRAVKMVFELFVRVGLSRRQISARLNAEGLTFNGGPFTHPDIKNILTNPAYQGDTHFGKVQTGDLHTFDAKGLITEIKKKRDKKQRTPSECLVKTETHEGLVDRRTWQLAQEKLADESGRANFSPRNPAYYLKQVFICGHCERNMTGRTEADPSNGKKTVIYVCSTYIQGRCNGHPVTCGYQRITHEEAERLLMGKIEELNLEYDKSGSTQARKNLDQRLDRLGRANEGELRLWDSWIGEGMEAFIDWLNLGQTLFSDEETERLIDLAHRYYDGLKLWSDEFEGLPMCLIEFRDTLRRIEGVAVVRASEKLAELTDEHRTLTLAWARASDMQQAVLKGELDRLEELIRSCKSSTVPISERLASLSNAETGRQEERLNLQAEFPQLESREKGEALRRLFKSVTLFWERTYHPPMAKSPQSKPRKTERKGRYSYKLLPEKFIWQFTTSDLEGSS